MGKESVLSDLATLVIFLNMRAHLAPPGVRLPFLIDLQALQKINVLRCFFLHHITLFIVNVNIVPVSKKSIENLLDYVLIEHCLGAS